MIKQQHQQQVYVEENMSNLTSAASGEVSVSSSNNTNRGEPNSSFYNPQQYYPDQNQSQDHDQLQQPPPKKKRSLPGNPDPDSEVIALSPKTLLATNRFVCEICNKGFQRDQNLQLHRRGHNLPWKLKQRTNKEVVRKKVYVCPEPSCVHHDPSRALGDLTGIKKHFCRKHGEKKWKCDKCSKRYAVQSDWKAHSKVCGTREYRCDCGTLFSRRDSFITHRAFCDALAEETARAITPPPTTLITNPISGSIGSPSTSHHFINQAQFNTHQDPLHTYPLKREQHQQSNLINLPPWLACPPTLDHHHQNPHLSSPSSSSSIFNQDQLMQSDPQPQQQQQQQSSNPSSINNNPSMGPTSLSFVPSLGAGPYHTQTAPHMSATALLQKAAQMGATMSKTATTQPHHFHHQHHHQGHVSDTNSNILSTTTTTTAGLFGLNLSSRDNPTGLIINHGLSSTGSDHIPGPNPSPSPGPSSSSFLHDMMINSLSSSYDNSEDAFGIGGLLGSSSKKDSPISAFHQTLGGQKQNDAKSNGNNDGLTRDFLGLRPLSHSDILSITGFGNCMDMNTTTSRTNHQDSH